MIPKWIEAGATRESIADACGVRVTTLKTFCAERRISLTADKQRYLTGFRNTLGRRIGAKRLAKLRAEARRRGMTDDALVGRLLSAIIEDAMYDAVLDEG